MGPDLLLKSWSWSWSCAPPLLRGCGKSVGEGGGMVGKGGGVCMYVCMYVCLEEVGMQECRWL